MRSILAILFATALIAPAAHADGEQAGDFDYYVLSLSWSPTWCAIEGDARGADQCDARHDYGWILHGLWPQYEVGHPSYCNTSARPPSRGETGAMVDVMASGGLAWHQWKKHGRCSGLTSQKYFATARAAYNAVVRPPVLRKLGHTVKLPASVIEDAFLQSNPDWTADMVTITCKRDRIQEARVCLTKDLQPRECGTDVVRDCAMMDALFDPIR
ncbi:MAG: ribonuclease T [Marinosulfonomonas sp.]|nr:MAG: ribonuclease T [Marinosulfonomonas sp.]